jgi:hypothetical protein
MRSSRDQTPGHFKVQQGDAPSLSLREEDPLSRSALVVSSTVRCRLQRGLDGLLPWRTNRLISSQADPPPNGFVSLASDEFEPYSILFVQVQAGGNRCRAIKESNVAAASLVGYQRDSLPVTVIPFTAWSIKPQHQSARCLQTEAESFNSGTIVDDNPRPRVPASIPIGDGGAD